MKSPSFNINKINNSNPKLYLDIFDTNFYKRDLIDSFLPLYFYQQNPHLIKN
jgi:hypothetical protein